MPEQRSALDVGFADFVAVLLVETLESIVAAHTSQEERLAALRAAADLTVEQFASTGITMELLDATAARLFPDGEGGTTLAVGGPVPEAEALTELDVVLGAKDIDDAMLTEAGVTRIREALTLYLAGRQLDAVREVDARGVPRVRVEGGTLRAKLNFTAVDMSPPDADTERPAADKERSAAEATQVSPTVMQPWLAARSAVLSPVTTRLTGSVGERLIAWDSPLQAGVLDSIRRTRLVVSTPTVPAGGGEPEPTSRAEVFGEVEIRFRTEE
jgi:hypothetical protein